MRVPYTYDYEGLGVVSTTPFPSTNDCTNHRGRPADYPYGTNNGVSFQFYPSTVQGDFDFAVEYCKSKGQKIATIRNWNEHYRMMDQFFELDNQLAFYWLGARIADDQLDYITADLHEDKFYWVDSYGYVDLDLPLSNMYSNWHYGEPNNFQDFETPYENCVQLCGQSAGWCDFGSWNDRYCGREGGGVVCEIGERYYW